MKTFLPLLFCLLYHCCAAQVDSLVQALAGAKGKERLDLLNRLTVLDTTENYRAYHRQAQELARDAADPSWKIQCTCAMGDHFAAREQPAKAILYYTLGIRFAKKYRLPHEEIGCLEKKGQALEDNGQPKEALLLFEEALRMSEQEGTLKETAVALEKLGEFYLAQRNYKLSFDHFTRQLRINEQLRDSSAMAVCMNNIGLIYYNRGDYPKGISYYEQAIAIKQKRHEEEEVAQARVNLGIVYKQQGMYEPALKNLQLAAVYFEKKKPGTEDLATCFNSMGGVWLELDQPENALRYFNKSLVIRKKLGNRKRIASSFTNIGNAYKEEAKYDLALSYLDSSLKIKNEIGDKIAIASSLDLMGEVYYLQNDLAQAETYYNQSLAAKKEVENPQGTAITLNKLGELYLALGKNDLAIRYLTEGRELATTIGARNELLRNYDITIKMLREQGDFKNAVFYYDNYVELKSDILDEQKNKDILELEIKYETEKKVQEISLLNETTKAQDATVSRQHVVIYSLIGGAFLLVAIALLSLNVYRSREKAGQVIIEQKQALLEQKQVLLRELHHRVKNNLQVVSSLLGLQQARTHDPAARETIRAIELRLNAMLLIHKNLYSGRLDSQVNVQEYLGNLADNLLSSFGRSATQVKILLHAENLLLDADKALSLGFVCNEIISNALKYAFAATEAPQISITLTETGASYVLAIADNGCGIPPHIDIGQSDSFGIRLIHLFAKDLRGAVEIASGSSGTRYQLTFPTH